MKRVRVRVSGVVQGVGFRPFIYGLAREEGLTGFVRNTPAGVEIEVEGERAGGFGGLVRSGAPPLSSIIDLVEEEIPLAGGEIFSILSSTEGGRTASVPPDLATCEDCHRELLDPGDRRYLYPFINCTNCGPRYSIIRKVPYDRRGTTMASFEMCGDCRREYDDPLDRRFHAQPDACPVCGPEVEFVRPSLRLKGEAAVDAAVDLLRAGGAVAVKGIGGYHIAVDGENGDAVRALRERKRKSGKAFALMAPDVETVRLFAPLSPDEETLLVSRERPIVLLRRGKGPPLPEAVAPGVPEIGFMLPYSPLHILLFRQGSGGGKRPNFRALVMTSGNLAEEPVARGNEEAAEKLDGLVDAFLHHDRQIFMRVDDSVVRSFGGGTTFIRRARGYVPSAVRLEEEGPDVLGCGADLKSTFTLTMGSAAVVSQHLGDMESFETQKFYEETLVNLERAYGVRPTVVAHDLHPGYFSTRWALSREEVEKVGVQHHHAHIASVMAEKGLRGKVLGIALDGSGYGADGTVWGGEFLETEPRSFRRLARFRPLPMPGGESAARNPWQMALSFLVDTFGESAGAMAAKAGMTERIGIGNVENLLRIREDRTLSPLTSGAGRLFESFAAILGLCDRNSYEAEGALALEAAALAGEEGLYRYGIEEGETGEVSFASTIVDLFEDIRGGVPPEVTAARCHNTVAAAVVEMARRLAEARGLDDVALSGGVFQNGILLEKVISGVTALGLRPHVNSVVPANDGGISLGQAFIARALLSGSDEGSKGGKVAIIDRVFTEGSKEGKCAGRSAKVREKK